MNQYTTVPILSAASSPTLRRAPTITIRPVSSSTPR